MLGAHALRVDVRHYTYFTIQMLLQPRSWWSAVRLQSPLLRSKSRCARRHHSLHGWRQLAWSFGLRLSFRYTRPQEGYYDWSCDLVHWFYDYLRIPEHRHAYCRSNHQWNLCWYLLCAGPCLHLGAGATQQTRSPSRCSAVGYYLGYFDYVLVGSFRPHLNRRRKQALTTFQHLLRLFFPHRPGRIPGAMGPPDDSRHYSVLWYDSAP